MIGCHERLWLLHLRTFQMWRRLHHCLEPDRMFSKRIEFHFIASTSSTRRLAKVFLSLEVGKVAFGHVRSPGFCPSDADLPKSLHSVKKAYASARKEGELMEWRVWSG